MLGGGTPLLPAAVSGPLELTGVTRFPRGFIELRYTLPPGFIELRYTLPPAARRVRA